jgi:hypothetical protein
MKAEGDEQINDEDGARDVRLICSLLAARRRRMVETSPTSSLSGTLATCLFPFGLLV